MSKMVGLWFCSMKCLQVFTSQSKMSQMAGLWFCSQSKMSKMAGLWFCSQSKMSKMAGLWFCSMSLCFLKPLPIWSILILFAPKKHQKTFKNPAMQNQRSTFLTLVCQICFRGTILYRIKVLPSHHPSPLQNQDLKVWHWWACFYYKIKNLHSASDISLQNQNP